MQLSPDLIEAFKEILCNPKEHKLLHTAIPDFFEESATVTAKHKLAEAYLNHLKLFTERWVPKMIIYIIMAEVYGQSAYKDEAGNLGYYLKPKDKKWKL